MSLQQLMEMVPEAERHPLLERLSKISPRWATVIKAHKKGGRLCIPIHKRETRVNHMDIAIDNAKYCIVGEAHKFSDDYCLSAENTYCIDCCRHCNGLHLARHRGNRTFESELEMFINHFEMCHL